MRVLVIEDSKTQAARLAAVLKRDGLTVETAYDGEAGIAACRAGGFDVVVSDIVMPGIDGFEVCRRLKADDATKRVPIVLLTSLADPLDVVKGVAAGADSFVPKPYDDASLVARVRKLAARGVRRDDDRTVEVAGETVELNASPGRMLDVMLAALEAATVRHAELEREHAATQRAVRDREELLAIVSHDLRNPLGALVTAAALAEHKPEDVAGTRAKLAVIRRSAERMNRLIGDLLDVSKIEAGRLTLERQSVECASLVDEAVSVQRSLADAKSLTLSAAIASGLPLIDADRERLLQVFANLLGNAIKFTPEGGSITARAELARDAAGHVCFTIVDTGGGIPAGDISHVFDRFWQAERTARQGTGLGLPIVKGIVEAHGGTVGVTSRLGAGTTFWFTIPVVRAS